LATRRLKHRIVIGESIPDALSFADLLEKESPNLEAEAKHRDDTALWLYSSGSTGSPKALSICIETCCIVVETYAKEVLDLGPERYHFIGRKTVFCVWTWRWDDLCLRRWRHGGVVSDRPTPDSMYAAIHRYRPTIFSACQHCMPGMLQMQDYREEV